MITRDRPELTGQTIRSMRVNASDWSRHRLVVVFDGTEAECVDGFSLGDTFMGQQLVRTGKQLGVGGAKNFGAKVLQQVHADQECDGNDIAAFNQSLLMFTDNDMYYLPGWDRRIEQGKSEDRGSYITQLGGWRHPFHQLGSRVEKCDPDIGRTYEVDAVTGNCFVMCWADWLRYGPFVANAIGPGQSEDFALSQRIKRAGGIVATLDPPVAIHCGMVNSEGEPAVGWREMEAMITEQLAAMPAEMRKDVLIMRPAPALSKLRQLGFEEVKQQQLQAFEDARAEQGMQPRQADARDVIPGPIAPVGLRREASVDEIRARFPPLGVGDGTIFESRDLRPIGLNCGSGQRRFESTREVRWINIDAQQVPPDRVPDVVCNVGVERLPMLDDCVQYVVLHQVLEHFGCGEATAMLAECWRVLEPGGSLIITVPDMRALAGRWLGGELDTQLYMTNMYGAYMGAEEDRHRWGYDKPELMRYLHVLLKLSPYGNRVRMFDWREIPGALIARDWWVLGVEVVKP